MPSSRGSSQPRDQNLVSHIAGRFFTIRATREAHLYYTMVYEGAWWAAIHGVTQGWTRLKRLSSSSSSSNLFKMMYIL